MAAGLKMKAVIITGQYKNLKLGQVLEVELVRQTTVFFKGIDRPYDTSICVFTDDEGKPIKKTEASIMFRKRN